jgi:hypothetical protein
LAGGGYRDRLGQIGQCIAKLLEELGNAAALARFLIRSRHIP